MKMVRKALLGCALTLMLANAGFAADISETRCEVGFDFATATQVEIEGWAAGNSMLTRPLESLNVDPATVPVCDPGPGCSAGCSLSFCPPNPICTDANEGWDQCQVAGTNLTIQCTGGKQIYATTCRCAKSTGPGLNECTQDGCGFIRTFECR